MREGFDLESAMRLSLSKGQGGTLITLIQKLGSSFRSVGAQVWIDGDGHLTGNVTGGCHDSLLRDMSLQMPNDSHRIVCLSTTGSEAEGRSGCSGMLTLAIETFSHRLLDEHLQGLIGATGADEQVLVTVLDPEMSHWSRHPHRPGVSMEEAAFWQESADHALAKQESGLYHVGENGKLIPIFCHYVPAQVSIALFGGMSVGVEFARLAEAMGWKLTVFDPREPLFEWDDSKFVSWQRWHPLSPSLSMATGTNVAVLATHNLDWDRAILEQLQSTPLRLLGVVGSKDRRAQLLNLFDSETKERLVRTVKMPLGKVFRNHAPSSVALSICNEIQVAFGNPETARGLGPSRSSERSEVQL